MAEDNINLIAAALKTTFDRSRKPKINRMKVLRISRRNG